MRRSGRDWWVNWVVCLCAGLWVTLLCVPHVSGRAGLTETLEYQLLDLRHRLTGPVSPVPDLVIVAIDDETLVIDEARVLARRSLLAQLIGNIAKSGAKGLALDVLLTDIGDPVEDVELASALGILPTVIAGAIGFSGQSQGTSSLIWPQDVFTAQTQTGVVNLSTDAGGTPRYAPMLIASDGRTLPSMPLLAALLAEQGQVKVAADSLLLGDREIALDLGLNLPLRYLGPAGTIPTISARELLNGPNPHQLDGKLVVLGFSAAAMGDRFATPFDESLPGMEVIATAISQLKGGPGLHRDTGTRKIDAAHAAGLTALSLFALLFWPLSRGVVVVLTLVGVSLASVTGFFSAGLWFSAALPLAAALPTVAVVASLRYRQEREQANRSEKTIASLRRFQSPALAQRLERDPDYLASPMEQNLVVVFVDITGFTGLSQQLGPEGTRKLLQAFHRRSSHCIESYSGSVFNYMGDGIMAVFGLESEDTSIADAALDASFDLTRSLSEIKLDELPDLELRCRVGLHVGEVTLSRLGDDSHQQVTVTGDTVNFASRLMEVAKSEAAVVAASSALCDALKIPVKTANARQTDVPIRGRMGEEHVFVWTFDAIESNDT